MRELYIGLMSGTSIDGVDAALVDFSGPFPKLLDCQTYPMPHSLLESLHSLCSPGENEIERLGRADRAVAEVFSQAALQLIKDNNVQAKEVRAIGSHGQTIRHMPEKTQGFSLQIGDPNTMAVLTEIDVVADFRRKDMALGGQGAPLVPAFHKAVFSNTKQARVVVNIGGIANLTYLPKTTTEDVIGFDTGPGNTLLDAWCKLHRGQNYDEKGQWAAQGTADPGLLKALSSHPYFATSAPKSTGRELFNLPWLESHIEQLPDKLEPQAVQATLVELTVQSIVSHIRQLGPVEQIYICGGGAHNDFLMAQLALALKGYELYKTDQLGVHTDAVEAMAFAWLAYAHLNHLPGSIASVTGATRDAVLGVFCPHPQ